MNKKEWISAKIRKLEHENKGRSHQENIAIAFSMWERGDHKLQQGGITQPEWYNMFTNPNVNLQAQTMSPQQPFQYIPPQTTGANIEGSLGQSRPQEEPLTQMTPLGLNPLQTTPNLSGVQQSYLQSQGTTPQWESTQKQQPLTGDEWQRYKLANIYGTGLGTSEALALTGKYAGEGNTGMAIGAGALSALKGTRDFLTGFGAGKTNKRTYEDYLKSLEKEQQYNYLSETPLQATAQQGGVIPNGTTPQQFATYQTSMQPVYQKSGDQGLNPLDYYKMLMQSSQTSFVEPPQQPDLTQQVYQESFIPSQDLTANDYMDAQNTMQQGGTKKDDYYQQGGQEQSSSDVTNAQMMTGAFITDQQNPTTNVEQGEYVKNAQTQEIVEAVGDKHKDGGIDVNLPQGSQVLSDFTKINKEEAKKFAKDYGVNVSTKDTYATVQDKINNKIGWTKTVKEEEDLIKKIEEVRNSSKDENTLNINMKFLQTKYKELNAKKGALQQEQKSAFDNLFNSQESHTKKGNGELINEDGTPMEVKKYGGEVYDLAKKYNVHPDRVHEMMQQGGSINIPESHKELFTEQAHKAGYDNVQEFAHHVMANKENYDGTTVQRANFAINAATKFHHQQGGDVQVQPNGQDMQSQVVQMLQNNVAPEQVVEILVQNNIPQEDAIRLVQAIVSGAQQQAQAPPVMQNGGTTPPVINSTLLTTFAQQPSNVSRLPHTPMSETGKDIWTGFNYNTVWKPLVEETMANPETAKKVENWLMTNKGEYSKNIQAQLEQLSGKDRAERIKKLATDYQPGPFHNAVLQAIQEVKPAAVPTPTAPEKTTITGQNQPITKTAVPVLPNPFVLPPSALQPVGKWDISLGRVEPSKMTAEPTIAALSQQQLAGQRSNLQNLTPEAAAAANAMLQATVGAQTNQALGQTEEANRQAIYASELQNLQQADKEKLTQAGINEAYQTKMYGAMNATDRDWRNYFKQQSGQDIQNYKDVQAMQLLNAMTPEYQYTGSDVVFSNRPYETPQQKSDRERQAEMLKYYQSLTPAQRAEMQKKGIS